ncbi:GEVED domain-containing protein [Asanoa sp. WMMD1127]|uniref:GEVED domain-containing protein n=1 Tax=Asanoa sp. WMMD1127 TaxID=3016107 RepID=UPI002416274C|nr:GEVED domain-containing protein [Asanoa sp. WMMD1127]MDG4820933.1 GEVED domain-containing protein [Asanoa sp. WMMD1127]
MRAPAPAPAQTTSATAAPAQAAAGCYGEIYLTRDRTLHRLGDDSPIAEFAATPDAVAWVPATRSFWAIAGDQVISFDQAGRITKRLPRPRALDNDDPVTVVTGVSSAATGAGDRWIVRTGRDVVTYRMPALKEIARRTLTAPGAVDILLRPQIADWDLDRGRLYSVVSGTLIGINLDTGRVTAIARPHGLPVTGTYGAVAIDPQRTVHALHDQSGRLYEIDLDDPGAAKASTMVGPATRSDAAACPEGWDFGDAPAPFPTKRAANGPRHRLTTGLTLGRTVTAESDATANDIDDALAKQAITDDGALTVRVTVTNATNGNALLAAWHDLDGNGRFDQRDLATARVKRGRTTVTLSWPPSRATARTSSTLRLRLYGNPGYNATPKPSGPADSGEVEDHPITIRQPAKREAPDPLDIQNLGATDAIPDPGAKPVAEPFPSPERPHHPVATAAPHRPERLPLTWSVFVGLLVPAASVAARAAAKRGSR